MAQAQIYISKRCPYCRKALMLLQQRQDLKGHIAVISIEGYCENGSCGLSFSSIDGNDVSNLSYSLLNDNPNSVPVENDGYVKKNERATKFDSDYEKMMEERGNMGMNGPQRH
jgi:glutaredoxin